MEWRGKGRDVMSKEERGVKGGKREGGITQPTETERNRETERNEGKL